MEIKSIRELSGLSQGKFAEKYNLPIKSLQNWEQGTRIPPEYVLQMLERIVKEDKEKEA